MAAARPDATSSFRDIGANGMSTESIFQIRFVRDEEITALAQSPRDFHISSRFVLINRSSSVHSGFWRLVNAKSGLKIQRIKLHINVIDRRASRRVRYSIACA